MAAVSSACLLASFVGCGSSNSSTTTDSGAPGTDSGAPTPEASTGDSGMAGDTSTTTEGGSTDGGDGAVACNPKVPPTGTQLVKSATTTIENITGDGQVIYYDSSTKTLNAVAVAGGGSPASIGAWDPGTAAAPNNVYVSGDFAVYFSSVSGGIGTLNLWSSAGGSVTVSTTAAVTSLGNGLLDVSADGSHIIYADAITQTGLNVSAAPTSGDAGAAKILAQGTALSQTCQPYFRFVGSYAVIATCGAAGGDGGTGPGSLTGYGPLTTWQNTEGLSSALSGNPFFWSDKAGTQVAFATTSGLAAETLGSGVSTPLDAKATAVQSGVFTSDGKSFIYTGNTSAAPAPIFRTTIASPAPVQVSSASFLGIDALSPDDSTLYASNTFANSNANFDLYLVPTAAEADGGSAAVTLSSAATAAFFGPLFTADGTQGLYILNATAAGVGDYYHVPLPATAAGTKIAPAIWSSATTTGTKTLYNDNYTQTTTSAYADIESVDVATTTAAATLVSGADAYFYVTADGKTYAYSWNFCQGAQQGIWAATAP